MKKVLVYFGTRPEAIKMAPLVLELQKNPLLKVEVGLSGQHKDMVKPIVDFFNLPVAFDLKISDRCQNIEDCLSTTLPSLCAHMRENRYDCILVHGDTSTTLAGALAGFYTQTPVGHVEAGLRSGSMAHPFPEEANRKLTASLCHYNFAATREAVRNLSREGIPQEHIYNTGNTIVDAVRIASSILAHDSEKNESIKKRFSFMDFEKPWILLTGHRRENLNETLVEVVKNTVALALEKNAEIVFPMHPNPRIRELLKDELSNSSPLKVIEPLSYEEMIWLYQHLSLIVTDSGGIQEEAASFAIPTLVTRKVTERKESVRAGLSVLVGENPELIQELGGKWMRRNKKAEWNFSKSPYGDGYAAQRIVQILENDLVTPRKHPVFRMPFQMPALTAR